MKQKVHVLSIDPAAPAATVHVAHGRTRDGAEIAFAVEHRAAGTLRHMLQLGARPTVTVQPWQVLDGR